MINKFDCALIIVLLAGLMLFAVLIEHPPNTIQNTYSSNDLEKLDQLVEATNSFSGHAFYEIYHEDWNQSKNCAMERGKIYKIRMDNEYNILTCEKLNITIGEKK